MPSLSWNETRDRAIAFAREYKDASQEEMQKHQFWIDFFQCFGVPLKSVAVFEKAVENLRGNYGFLDLFFSSSASIVLLRSLMVLALNSWPQSSSLIALILRGAPPAHTSPPAPKPTPFRSADSGSLLVAPSA